MARYDGPGCWSGKGTRRRSGRSTEVFAGAYRGRLQKRLVYRALELGGFWPRRRSTCCRNEAEVMGYRWMIYKCVCDHFGKQLDSYSSQRQAIAIIIWVVLEGRDHLYLP